MRQQLHAYVVTDVRGGRTTYQARNARQARQIAEGEGMRVASVFRE
jgi:hypothetical protein